MFNLEQAIAEWRDQMQRGGVRTPEFLDELESHLRDDVERQTRAGLNLEQAFAAASTRIGRPVALRPEFSKLGGMNRLVQRARRLMLMVVWDPHFQLPSFRVKPAVLALAGIPNQYVDTPADAPCPNIEPRWATYFRAMALFGPALLLWTMLERFVAPKLWEVCFRAGLQNRSDIPPFIRYFSVTINSSLGHWRIFARAVILVLMLLEWRSTRWPRYRRATLGLGALLLNLAVLIAISLMGLVGVLAASMLEAHLK